MKLVRQKLYSHNADEDQDQIEEFEEEKSDKNYNSRKNRSILKNAAVIGGSGLALAGGYQLMKHTGRKKSRKKLFDATKQLISDARKASTDKSLDTSKSAYKLAKKIADRNSKESKLEKLGHKSEDWIKSLGKKDK